MRHARLISWVALWAALFGACQDHGVGTSAAEAQAVTPPAGKGTPAQNFLNAYLVAQTKLAADDFAGARAAFAGVKAASQVPAVALAPELKKRFESAAAEGAGSQDITKLRSVFAGLSDAMLTFLAAQPNPLPVALSVAHCPMALEGKGAKWLQPGEQLRNPYFGPEMLTCGTVETSLKPGKKL